MQFIAAGGAGDGLYLSGTHGVSAPVHRQTDPGGEGALVRGEEDDRLGHLAGVTGPAQGVGGLAVLQELLVPLLVQAASLLELRHDDPRVDAVDSDLLANRISRSIPIAFESPEEKVKVTC